MEPGRSSLHDDQRRHDARCQNLALVNRIPKNGLSFVATAATVPVVFLTVLYGLQDLGRVAEPGSVCWCMRPPAAYRHGGGPTRAAYGSRSICDGKSGQMHRIAARTWGLRTMPTSAILGT